MKAEIEVNGSSLENLREPPQEQPTRLRPSRRERRAAAARERQLNARVRSHNCVLHRDAVAAGVSIEINNPVLFHKLHSARAEPYCPACVVCEQFRTERRRPTIFSRRERAALQLYWRNIIALHKNAPGMGALFNFLARCAE